MYLLEVKLSPGSKKGDILKQAQLEHTKDLASKTYDLKYLEELNTLMCLKLFEEYTTLLDKDELKTDLKPSTTVRRCERLISLLRRACSNLRDEFEYVTRYDSYHSGAKNNSQTSKSDNNELELKK